MGKILHICNTTASHYTVRILLGILLIELILMREENINHLWATISLIVVIEPQVKKAWTTFNTRFINTILGSLIGIGFLFSFGIHINSLPAAVAVSAFASAYLTKLQQGWRIAPVTTAIIMSAGITATSVHDAYEVALHRTLAVLLGSVVALVLTEVLSFIWIPPDAETKE